MHAAWPRFGCRPICRPCLLDILYHPSNTRRPQEHAIVLLHSEVPLPLDGAIVLSSWLFEFYAHPVSGLEVGTAYEANSCYTAVVQFDFLPYSEGRCVHGW